MKKYKLTDQNLQTHNGFQWEVGVKQVIQNPSNILASSGVFHFCDSLVKRP